MSQHSRQIKKKSDVCYICLHILFHTHAETNTHLYIHTPTHRVSLSLPPSLCCPSPLGKSIEMTAITSHLGVLICLPELLTRCWLLVGCLRRLLLSGVSVIGHRDESSGVYVGLLEEGKRRNEIRTSNLQRELDVKAFTKSRILPPRQFHIWGLEQKCSTAM